MMLCARVTAALLVCLSLPSYSANLEALRPSARWLATERLRGTLFHDPLIEPLRPIILTPAVQRGRSKKTVPVIVRGWHHLLVLPDGQGRIVFRLRALSRDTHFDGSLYALFDPTGQQVAEGVVAAGRSVNVSYKTRVAGPHIILLNSGPASGNACEITVRNPQWVIDARPRQSYGRTPLHYHFLRDLKLGGFNLAMIDFERLPQEFSTEAGLTAWTELVREWTEYARRCELRVMPAIDLGGTSWEVEAWGDAPKGLYIDPDPKLPLAPCPLQKIYWERILLRRARAVAELSRDNPYIVGFGIDPEMYQCWRYGHYMLSGTCFCDYCLGGFLRAHGLDQQVLATKATGNERHEWLKAENLMEEYYRYLADEMTAIAAWCREEIHRINPDLLLNMFVIEIGNWFCEGIARGMSLPDLPIVNFCEHTYYSVGYDSAWLQKTHERFTTWGANVLQGSALWDLHFPPTKPSFLAAHAYNLAVRDEGWWYWPGDQLYRDYGSRYAYLEQPAYFEDYWDACVWANREITTRLSNPNYVSTLEAAEVVPWKGKIESGVPKTPEEIMRPQSEPSLPVRVAAPTTLYFVVPPRCTIIELLVQARGANNAAIVSLYDPNGNECARVSGELEAPEKLTASVSTVGTWSVAIATDGDQPLRDVGLRIENFPTTVSPDPKSLLVPPTKQPGLIGYWPLDEGQGNIVTDTSQEPAYNGRLRDCRWAEGRVGHCLQFDGKSGEVLIPAEFSFHNLTQFTLSAWVKLTGLPVQGNGNTLVNKGPESPVQHFWWWIGYPPSYSLVLEMGSEAHRWGASFSSDPLDWELGRWYHVAVVFESAEGSSKTVHYRDGQMVGTVTREEAFNSGSYDIRLGTYGGLHWMDGYIDEVKFWDRALSAEEIRLEYEAAP
ncbi:MAG: LamG domain-containing protein [Candidatus Zipacnadales bacterium]